MSRCLGCQRLQGDSKVFYSHRWVEQEHGPDRGSDAGALPLFDQFYAIVKRIVEEEGPLGAKIERVRQLREGVLSEIEALLRSFDQREF